MEVENSTRETPPPPEAPRPAAPADSTTAASGAHPEQKPSDKAGRFMANLKIGPAPCLTSTEPICPHQGALAVEVGVSILPNKNAYLLLPLQFQFDTSGSAIIVPLGFQYDFAVSRLPGFYLYPRLSIGYAFLSSLGASAKAVHAGMIVPEFGLKYVISGRFNVGGELLSLPILFGKTPIGSFANLSYRILLSFGVNF